MGRTWWRSAGAAIARAAFGNTAWRRGRRMLREGGDRPGKRQSWLIRLLAEQLFGKVQVILIDPEGEFASLREKFDYVLVGKGGETPADPRSAALLAHKLLEVKASAVCDLYEMKP